MTMYWSNFIFAIRTLQYKDEEIFSTESKKLFDETLNLILAMGDKSMQEFDEVEVANALETIFVTLEKNGIYPIDENQAKELFTDEYKKAVRANEARIREYGLKFLTAWSLRIGGEDDLITPFAFGKI